MAYSPSSTLIWQLRANLTEEYLFLNPKWAAVSNRWQMLLLDIHQMAFQLWREANLEKIFWHTLCTGSQAALETVCESQSGRGVAVPHDLSQVHLLDVALKTLKLQEEHIWADKQACPARFELTVPFCADRGRHDAWFTNYAGSQVTSLSSLFVCLRRSRVQRTPAGSRLR